MAALWRESGLRDVEQTSLTLRMRFRDFDDYWTPLATGKGPHGQYVTPWTEDSPRNIEETFAPCLHWKLPRQSPLHDRQRLGLPRDSFRMTPPRYSNPN